MDAPPPLPAAIAVLPAATLVGAGAGCTAWSELRSGRYVLDVRTPDGVVTMPPVPSRGVPFDIDVGLDAARRPVAAYSRCSTEPRPTGGANTIGPQWTSGRGCTLRLLDLATGRETKVARSKADASEVLPSLRGTQLAYIAVPRRHGERIAQLRRRDVRTGRSVLLDRGPRRAAGAGFAEGPTSVDAGLGRVAAVWRYRDAEFHSFDTDLRVSRRSVAGASNTEDCNYETVLSPTLVGDAVYYLDTTGTDWVLGRTS